jgi:hypothetical protein
MTISEKIQQLKSIDISKMFDEVLKEKEPEIIEMVKGQMYDEGIVDVNKPGQKLQYAESTKKKKRKAPFNKTDFITLKWTGAFHDALKLIVFKDKFTISSKNKIWGNYLEPQERFGHALGLTEDSKAELRDTMKDGLINKIRESLRK